MGTKRSQIPNLIMSWIKYPTNLEGETVKLITLREKHFEELSSLARDKRIWEFYPYDGSSKTKFRKIFATALAERKKGSQFPFAIFHKSDGKIIGSTRLLDIEPRHRKLEIGATWLHPDYWATFVNPESKLLLLTFCFEKLHAVRVQLKTDENNLRSRKAIEKIGGQFEGILRNDMLRENNSKRNSAYYSILDEEWPGKKIGLTKQFLEKRRIV
jgi:RimJ/RimL family protein N-acetyltransferase